MRAQCIGLCEEILIANVTAYRTEEFMKERLDSALIMYNCFQSCPLTLLLS